MTSVITAITPAELAAIRAVVETDLQHFGSVFEETKPELYAALVSVKAKFAKLARPSETEVSA